jgi:alpha-glucoside transport system permease protein
VTITADTSHSGATSAHGRIGVAARMRRRWNPTRVLGARLRSLVMAGIAALWLLPTVGLFVASLRTRQNSAASGWWTALVRPGELTLQNYANLLHNSTVTGSLLNTALITVSSTVLVILIAALAAYALAWLDFPHRDRIFLTMIGLLVVPIQVGLLPVAKLYAWLGLFGTIPGVVLFHVAYGLPFAVFLLRQYFASIPRDLLEAARIDGSGEILIFRRIVLPIGLPAIASLGIFQFLFVWNDLLVALVFAGTNTPLTVALQQQTTRFSQSFDVLASGAFLSMTVPLVVFFAFQRYFVQGVLAGSVK